MVLGSQIQGELNGKMRKKEKKNLERQPWMKEWNKSKIWKVRVFLLRSTDWEVCSLQFTAQLYIEITPLYSLKFGRQSATPSAARIKQGSL